MRDAGKLSGKEAPDVEGAAISRALLVAALLAMSVLIGTSFLVFRPAKDAWTVILGGSMASLLAILIVYVLRLTILRPMDRYASKALNEDMAERIISIVKHATSSETCTCYERWNDVDWGDLFKDVMRLDIVVSYMDTWVILAHEPLLGILQRGGSITIYLPSTSDASVARVDERFPEYSRQVLKEKIENTASKLRQLQAEAENPEASLHVYHTDTFIMHCLMRIDDDRVLFSPFDHFRRGRIEGPAFLADSSSMPGMARWVIKEIAGFAAEQGVDNHRSGESEY